MYWKQTKLTCYYNKQNRTKAVTICKKLNIFVPVLTRLIKNKATNEWSKKSKPRKDVYGQAVEKLNRRSLI